MHGLHTLAKHSTNNTEFSSSHGNNDTLSDRQRCQCWLSIVRRLRMSEPQMTSGRERPFCSENRTRKCHKIGVSSNFLFMVRSLQYVCVCGCVWVWVYVCVCVCVCVCGCGCGVCMCMHTQYIICSNPMNNTTIYVHSSYNIIIKCLWLHIEEISTHYSSVYLRESSSGHCTSSTPLVGATASMKM